MNERNLTRSLASAVCAAAILWAPMALASPEEPVPAAAHGGTLTKAEYEAMLEEAERARVQAEAARQEAERAASRARETAGRHADLARAEAEQARRESMEAAERSREAAREGTEHAREAAERERGMAEERRHQAEERRRRERAIHREEMERIQEELSRAHRELREATREIARAHRDVARNIGMREAYREINLGERAVLGVILGPETPEGVKVVGVSPGGPAERAGLQAGDVIVSVRGEPLAGEEGKAGRETLYRVMNETKAGEMLAVVVDRAGESWTFDVTPERREPSSWQTMIRIPGAPAVPGAPDAPPVIVEHLEHIEIPDIDVDALNDRIEQLSEELESRQFMFVAPDGETFEFDGTFHVPESFDVEIDGFSELAENAMREANIWFGLPQVQGLELARVNEGLGAYFKTERGVLVLEARPDNAYQLEPGDVVLDVNSKAVSSPADLMRALREIEPGDEVKIAIKRDRRDKVLTVTMPENRLGCVWESAHPPETGHGN